MPQGKGSRWPTRELAPKRPSRSHGLAKFEEGALGSHPRGKDAAARGRHEPSRLSTYPAPRTSWPHNSTQYHACFSVSLKLSLTSLCTRYTYTASAWLRHVSAETSPKPLNGYVKMTVPTCRLRCIAAALVRERGELGFHRRSTGQHRSPIEMRGRFHELCCRPRPLLPSAITPA